MSAIREMLGSESFNAMVVTICSWLFLYIIVKVMTVRAGVGNLLAQAGKRIAKLRRRVVQLRLLCTAEKPASTLDKQIRLLKKIIKTEKWTEKVLVMYLFDDRTDFDVAEAKRLVSTVPDASRSAISKVGEDEENDVSEIFDTMDDNMKTALSLLEKASRLDRKKELLQM